MAKVHFEGETKEVADGGRVYDACDDLGMPFGCTDGLCGTCICRVVSGAENLAPKNDKEIDMDLDDNQRLACQAEIKGGEVEFALD